MDRPLACLPTSHVLSSSSSSSSGGATITTTAVGGVTAGVVFDVSGLVLYRAQAVPIKLKVLLDRLMAGVPSDQVVQTLSAYGWTYDDYSRGYMLQVCGFGFLSVSRYNSSSDKQLWKNVCRDNDCNRTTTSRNSTMIGRI